MKEQCSMSNLWLEGHVQMIPSLEPSELAKRVDKYKPIIEQHNRLWTIKPVDPETVAFTWDPVIEKDVTDQVYEVTRIETYHTCAFIGFFKPTISEVVSQIPSQLLDHELITHFRTLTSEYVACFRQGDGHRTITILYGTK